MWLKRPRGPNRHAFVLCLYKLVNKSRPQIVFTAASFLVMLRAIIMGPPGSGKGTISSMIVERFNLKHVSSGDLLRAHGSSPGNSSLKTGQLVDDNLVEKLVLPKLLEVTRDGWLLDGFPRTLHQAKLLLSQEQVDMMIDLKVPDQTIISRLQGRWVHLTSGRIYHTSFHPPRVVGVDDLTGEPLQQREDDTPEVIQHRLNIYHTQTKEVLEYFKSLGILHSYSGTASKEIWPHIEQDIVAFLKIK